MTLCPFGDVIKLSFEDSKKYAGLLTLPVLCKLKNEFTIDCTATITASDSHNGQSIAAGRVKKRSMVKECDVRIVLYGLRSEAGPVSRLLSNAGLYLQQPSALDLRRDIVYWNPHILIRPGSQMPTLQASSTSLGNGCLATSDSLNETQKNRFMQIFNAANGFNEHSSVEPSPRLMTELNM